MTKKEKIETKDWTYVGEVKNGKPHGKGVRNWASHVKFKSDSQYKGQFKAGKEHGFGKLKIDQKGEIDYYEGSFQEGKFHGKGIYYSEFKNKKKFESKHIGFWKNGRAIKGKILEYGDTYHGDWKSTIDVDWSVPLKQGKGKIIYPEGSKFVGEFYNDSPLRGAGTIHFSDSKYVGEMRTKDGSLDAHGEGIETFKDGAKLIGIWKDGTPIKAHKYTFSYKKEMKLEYKGGLKKGAFHGKGTVKTIRTTVPKYFYEKGTFLNNLLEGRGIKIYYDDKKFSRAIYIYKGEFKKGEYHGKGLEWRYPDKHFIEGLFKNNKFQGSKKNPLTKKVFKIILDANDLNK